MINITNIEGKRSEASPLPLTPPVPPDTKPEKTMPPTYTIMSRRGVGSKGRRIPLLTNHFGVSVNAPDLIFYQYSVCIFLKELFVGTCLLFAATPLGLHIYFYYCFWFKGFNLL